MAQTTKKRGAVNKRFKGDKNLLVEYWHTLITEHIFTIIFRGHLCFNGLHRRNAFFSDGYWSGDHKYKNYK